ncbi:unnamed protein product [Peronospora belbahrii]|uniref:Uncharacterized protein n=1 Tax=Peronospora belbahrii TaxID=622444 RepID=A0AAU9L4B1_9STRA|nr:unnamed protein product [Peronospora belbahrii]
MTKVRGVWRVTIVICGEAEDTGRRSFSFPESTSSPALKRTLFTNLYKDAPRDLVTYLNDQMSVIHQEKLEIEYGRGQGYIVTLPLPSSKLKAEVEGADVIINELKRRMSSMAEKWDIEKAEEVEDSNVVKELISKGDTLLNNEQEEEEKSTGDDATDMAMMIRLKQYYQKLES